MALAKRSVARFKPEIWEKLVPLFELGLNQAQIVRLSKIHHPLVAMARRQWAQSSQAEASRLLQGAQPSQPPRERPRTNAEKVASTDDLKRRSGQLDKFNRLLSRKLPLKTRVDLLVSLATHGDSSSVKLRALEMIHDLEGLNTQAKNPAPPVRVPLFHMPPGAPRPSVASGASSEGLDVGESEAAVEPDSIPPG